MQNYKVFINKGLIFFGQNGDCLTSDLSWPDFQTISPEDFPKIVERIKDETFEDYLFVDTDHYKNAFELLVNQFIVKEAAGGIVQNQRSDFLMIHRFEKWDFPKGHLEKGELEYQGAIREVMEETGIKTVSICKKVPCTYHIYRFNREWVVKKTHWYLMKSEYTGKLIPQQEEGILAALWIPYYTMEEYIQQSYPALQDLYRYITNNELLEVL